ncbi:MAG: hypothetical protein IID32_01865, partial [Planctomycetes bacterium]|nr:hypothetical protein [Planctomycetota bacterium]
MKQGPGWAVVAAIVLGNGLVSAAIPEPDVRLHGLLSIGGVTVVPGDDVALVARVEGTPSPVGRFDYNQIPVGDCDRDG